MGSNSSKAPVSQAETSVSGEPLKVGAIARVFAGIRGLVPARIAGDPKRGRIDVQPLDGDGWGEARSVSLDDVRFLLTPQEVRRLGMTQ